MTADVTRREREIHADHVARGEEGAARALVARALTRLAEAL